MLVLPVSLSPSPSSSSPPSPSSPPVPARQRHVYLLEQDAGILCRVIGLYAARGITIEAIDAVQEEEDMRLSVTARIDPEVARILCAKAASLYGVVHCGQGASRPSE